MSSLSERNRLFGHCGLLPKAYLSLFLIVALMGLYSAKAHAADVISYEIPAGPLGEALTQFGAQSGLLLSFDPVITSNKNSDGLKGRFTAPEGLQRLLVGTGLDYRFVDAGTVTLARKAVDKTFELEAITITGLRDPSAQIGLFGERDKLDIPFSVESFSTEQIERIQARSVREVLELDPSVRSNTTSFVAGENYIVRGLNITASESLFDGLPGLVPASTPTSIASVERLELFKGPSTTLNGSPIFGSSAGTVNLVPKRAEFEPFTRLTADYKSDSQFGGEIDINRGFGPLALRVFGTLRDGDTAFDKVAYEETVLGGSAVFASGPLTLSLDLLYQEQDLDGSSAVIFPTGPDLPDPPDSGSSLGSDQFFLDTETFTALVSGQYDISDKLTLNGKFGYSSYDELQSSNVFFIEDADGNGTVFPFVGTNDIDGTTAFQLGLTARFTTGFVDHELAVRVDGFDTEVAFGELPLPSYSTNLYDPDGPPLNIGQVPDLGVFKSKQRGVGIFDTLSLFEDRLQIGVGARWQESMTRLEGEESIEADEISPSFTLNYRPTENWAIYASYVEGLGTPTTTSGGSANPGELIPPPVTEQVEIGVKYGSRLGTITAAAFETTVPQRYRDPITNIDGLNGENEYRGAELIGDIRPAEPWRINAGVTFLDAEQQDTAGGAQDGFDAQAAPEISASLYTDYQVNHWLSVNGRLVYTGESFVDAQNNYEIDANTRIDLGAQADFTLGGTDLVARFSVVNVTDREYWVIGRNFASLADPRTFLLTISGEF